MTGPLHFLRLLTMTIWVGGLVFFAFVLAPAAFHTLPNVHEAGLIVGASLRMFDRVGLACGGVFLVGTFAWSRRVRKAGFRLPQTEMLLAGAMLLLTSYLHWGILPAMDGDRERAGGDISSASKNDPARMHFDRLHARSERVEGGVLLIGLVVIYLLSREGTQVGTRTGATS